MATNIQMYYNTGSGYELLYPQTTSANIVDLNTTLSNSYYNKTQVLSSTSSYLYTGTTNATPDQVFQAMYNAFLTNKVCIPFKQSGTFVAPSGILNNQITVVCVGGGGGGGGNIGAGGGSGYITINNTTINPGSSYSVIVGAGGDTTTGKGDTGGASSFNGQFTANGGEGGEGWNSFDGGTPTYKGGSGNAGGGGGAKSENSSSYPGGNGGNGGMYGGGGGGGRGRSGGNGGNGGTYGGGGGGGDTADRDSSMATGGSGGTYGGSGGNGQYFSSSSWIESTNGANGTVVYSDVNFPLKCYPFINIFQGTANGGVSEGNGGGGGGGYGSNGGKNQNGTYGGAGGGGYLGDGGSCYSYSSVMIVCGAGGGGFLGRGGNAGDENIYNSASAGGGGGFLYDGKLIRNNIKDGEGYGAGGGNLNNGYPGIVLIIYTKANMTL